MVPQDRINEAFQMVIECKPEDLDVQPIIDYFQKTWMKGSFDRSLWNHYESDYYFKRNETNFKITRSIWVYNSTNEPIVESNEPLVESNEPLVELVSNSENETPNENNFLIIKKKPKRFCFLNQQKQPKLMKVDECQSQPSINQSLFIQNSEMLNDNQIFY
ncbi:unnamed protein product, partial [Brachionus calyciflorus]